MLYVDLLIHGVFIGALIALVAAGYALIYSILRFINFSHGEVMLFGAYSFLILHKQVRPLWLSGIMAIGVTALLGLAIEHFIYRPLRHRSSMTLFLSSLGISIALQSIYALIFGSSPQSYQIRAKQLTLGQYVLHDYEVLTVVLTVGIFLLLDFLLRKTTWGLALRGTAVSPHQVSLWGLSVDIIYRSAFAVSSAIAAIAGIVVGQHSGLTPTTGFNYSLWSFSACVLGGLGSLRGTVSASLFVGIVFSFMSAKLSSVFLHGWILLAVSLVLIIRPEGLFPKRIRKF
jgi:branched-chain amino acid transport system permease protein